MNVHLINVIATKIWAGIVSAGGQKQTEENMYLMSKNLNSLIQGAKTMKYSAQFNHRQWLEYFRHTFKSNNDQ